MPPDGTTHEYHIVVVKIIHRTAQFRTNTVIQLITGYLRTLVVIRRIGIDSFDTEQRTAGHIRNLLCQMLRIAAPTEIGNKDFAICVVLD